MKVLFLPDVCENIAFEYLMLCTTKANDVRRKGCYRCFVLRTFNKNSTHLKYFLFSKVRIRTSKNMRQNLKLVQLIHEELVN